MFRSSSASADSVASTASRLSAHRLSSSSSSSDKSYLSIVSDVDPRDNFYNSEERAGGPYLCSLPARTVQIDRRWYTHYAKLMSESGTLCSAISDILETEGMRQATVEIIGRQSKVHPEHHALPTVLILASRKEQPDRQDWRAISRIVYRWMSRHFPGINVEILDNDEAQTPRCYPVKTANSIYAKWGPISRAILRRLDIRQWTSIQCYRYGTHREPSRNPITILVTVCYTAEDRFLDSQAKIQAILASFGENTTAVVFLQDEFEHLVDYFGAARLDQSTISDTALPGVSLGIKGSSAGSSTFGGYIELLFPGQQWNQYGLTCFNCVYPPPEHREALLRKDGAKEAFARWEYSPITKHDTRAREILQIEQPSAHDLRANIDRITGEISAYEDDKFKDLVRRLDQGSDEVDVADKEREFYKRRVNLLNMYRSSRALLQAFLIPERCYLGPVVFGSGFHRARNSRDDVMPSIRDWALIQIAPRRLGERNVHTYGQEFPPPETMGLVTSRKPEESQTLIKSGRSTRVTEGRYGGLKSIHITKEQGLNGKVVALKTEEHSVTPSGGGPFAEPGDSGSLIFNSGGDVVGLLVAGGMRVNVAYFQHILDVFDDIKDVTGAVDIRLM